MERDFKLMDYIKQNPGFEKKSKIEKDYLSLNDKFKNSNCNCHYLEQLIMLGYEYDDEYVVPEYQRDLVWTLEQKQNLIKSILYGNPIGDFLFKVEKGLDEKNRINDLNVIYSIIDGQQRLNAIREYVNNQFEVDNKTFSQLKYWDARTFLNYQVKVTGIENITLEEEINIYLNRNCGGSLHTKEEINKAIDILNNKSLELSI